MTDPVSDFLTRLRNASKAGQAECVAPHSKLKESFALILKAEGYVSDVTIVTTANTDDEGRELLKLMGMPFRRTEAQIAAEAAAKANAA